MTLVFLTFEAWFDSLSSNDDFREPREYEYLKYMLERVCWGASTNGICGSDEIIIKKWISIIFFSLFSFRLSSSSYLKKIIFLWIHKAEQWECLDMKNSYFDLQMELRNCWTWENVVEIAIVDAYVRDFCFFIVHSYINMLMFLYFFFSFLSSFLVLILFLLASFFYRLL